MPFYPDLLEGRPEPLWWDERGVPRWLKWEPGIGEEGYVDEAVLLLIMCQSCGHKFRVSMHHDWYEGRIARNRGRDDSFARRIRERTLHYGDPPCSPPCCDVGPTMNSVPLRVLEYWHRPIVGPGGLQWQRNPELEVSVIPDWWEDDQECQR